MIRQGKKYGISVIKDKDFIIYRNLLWLTLKINKSDKNNMLSVNHFALSILIVGPCRFLNLYYLYLEEIFEF
jgi:hypothetical protein